ncbi:cytochrome P450 [Rhodococcus sp. HNM0569]|uniref:cytochrome P450 n=1 Tax=Rhodococcus sp. HNM0569 TaxID=2716340 RepID=UPI00146F6116|nr:cytochrome P450 [Rhodococcus sp. HNM0569]NLU83311.1 cytochrome P450 [Rhodococcus sp. HNM0569]
MANAIEPVLPPGFDFTDPAVIERGVPFEQYRELRRTSPVWWNPQPRGVGGFDDDGFWVVSRHDDVREVSRRSDIFSNHARGAIPRLEDDISREEFEATLFVLINKDAPEHSQLRRLVSPLFTPRAIEGLRATLTERAHRIVADAVAAGSGDFVTQVASELPMHAIAELIGIPEADRRKLYEWTGRMTGYDDPELAAETRMASAEVLAYAWNAAESRRAEPQDDIITRLIEAEIDGDALTSEQFGFFVVMLAVAGNETTRNATTHGILAFMEHPEQWELFRRTRPRSAVDEIIRWATPLTALQRTAVEDTELGGQHIRAGDRVVLLYGSANFDEDVFDDPDTFDITRDPNPHLSFGGTGAHYCIGANLARMEIGIIFDAIAEHAPDIARLGDPVRLRSGWLNGVKSMEVSYGGGCPVAHGRASL